MTTKTMIEMTIDDFEKFKEEALSVFECIYEENLIYNQCGSRIKYLIKTFPNMKRQVLIDILKFVVNSEFDDEVDDEEELDNFIEILYKYQ